MAYLHTSFFGKIANPHFALTALRNDEAHGEFKAIVRFAEASKCPSDLKVLEVQAQDLLKLRIPCDRIGDFIEDGNVLRVELSEYVSNGSDPKAFED